MSFRDESRGKPVIGATELYPDQVRNLCCSDASWCSSGCKQ